MNVRIYPSQLAFAYEDCPRCLWLLFRKVAPARGGYDQFNLMDRVQQRALPKGTDLRPLGIPGEVAVLSDWAESRDYRFEGGHTAHVVGKYDLLAALDGGGLAVVDLKTAKPGPDKAALYRKQLSGYALALVEPARFEPLDVRAAYVLPWWPDEEVGAYVPEARPPSIVVQLRGYALEARLDLDEVRASIAAVVAAATREDVPEANGDCPNCRYVRDYGRMVRESRETMRRREEGISATLAEATR